MNTISIIGMITAQKMKFSITDFFSKCDQIRSFLQSWPHLLKKSITENFHFLCSMMMNCFVKLLNNKVGLNLFSSWNHKNGFSKLQDFVML